MYNEKVTSYWYFLICSQRTSEERSDLEAALLVSCSLLPRAYSGMLVLLGSGLGEVVCRGWLVGDDRYPGSATREYECQI